MAIRSPFQKVELADQYRLDPAAVRGAVLENTGIKFIYRAKTSETAQWASELSGTIIAQTRRISEKINGIEVLNVNLNDYSNKEAKHPGLLRTAGRIGLRIPPKGE